VSVSFTDTTAHETAPLGARCGEPTRTLQSRWMWRRSRADHHGRCGDRCTGKRHRLHLDGRRNVVHTGTDAAGNTIRDGGRRGGG